MVMPFLFRLVEDMSWEIDIVDKNNFWDETGKQEWDDELSATATAFVVLNCPSIS